MKFKELKSIGIVLIIVAVAAFLHACGGSSEKEKGKFAPPPPAKPLTYEEAVADWKNQKGLGPIREVELGEFDEALAKKGEEIYALKCTACHAPDKEKLGPAPVGVLERRTPEWIMNMILNPEQMALKDPIARGLLMKYNTVMANQGLTEEDARAVLEYFRTL
jgi:mono/diheme cytochrome c family protein